MHVEEHLRFMRLAIEQARLGMTNNEGGPFGAVVVKNGQVIAAANNRVTSTNDPTAHAEIVAIREACRQLGSFQLNDCILYTSCEPCPMCLGAIYWARPAQVFFACTRRDAAAINFDDDFIYREIVMPPHERRIPMFSLLREEALPLFTLWREKEDKTPY
ncbi:MAG: nucleoside deaminase [Saprospiraceae bacterium]|nr:nucleoside deaminase [Saprospiraceae bacterium]MDW8483688.1 nucleoside deaminase [Saprospiraceae bacterium]